MTPVPEFISALSLLLGTSITITSNHGTMAWASLEINTLAIILLISKSHHPWAIETTTKYFLVQATASALVLFSSMSNAWSTS